MILKSVISQGSSSFNDIETPVDTIVEAGVTTVITSFYWFRPYKASDFPEITCDKTYFFLYGSDHDVGAGGIYWGKGNNLDLSDFEEVALIIEGDQTETPFLYRFPDKTRPIHLYYHTTITEPGNDGVQQTRLITTTGGVLDSATWVDEGRPLGLESYDQHTGYMKFWNVNGQLKAVHYTVQDLGDVSTWWQHSTFSSNGLSVTRGAIYDAITNIESGYRTIPPFGWFFLYGGQWWWVGIKKPTVDWTKWDNILTLCKVGTDLEPTEEVTELNGGTEGGSWEIYIEDNIAHFYHMPEDKVIEYTSWSLNNLSAFL